VGTKMSLLQDESEVADVLKRILYTTTLWMDIDSRYCLICGEKQSDKRNANFQFKTKHKDVCTIGKAFKLLGIEWL
jgi:hypothetical protein